jgi:UDP-glucose 4-epimerase
MKVFVTGGAGYVGSACLRWLVRHGHTALAYDNLCEGNAAAVDGAKLVVGDLEDRAKLSQSIGEFRPDAVMHFAAVASVPESIKDPESYYRINVQGTKNLLDAMLEHKVLRIVFSSTAATYGFTDKMPLREDSAQVPEVPYGRSKLAAEWLIRDYCKAYNVGFTIFRYFNASGADPDGKHGESRKHEAHLIPLAFSVAVGVREKLLVFGGDYPTRDGTCVRDYVHTADLGSAHQLAVESLQPGMERFYNLGSGVGTTVKEVLDACEAVIGKPINHEIVGRRPGDPAVLIASDEKIRKELGWKPAFDVQQIAATAWQWHKANPHGYKR